MTDTVARLSASLSDRYRIERELGAGGMAYRAGSALIAARVSSVLTFRLLGRDTLLSTFGPEHNFWSRNYDVAAAGRILAIAPQSNEYQLVVSPNWITEFRRRVAESGR